MDSQCPKIQNGQKIVVHIPRLTNLRVFVLTVYPLRLQIHEHSQRMLTQEWFSVLPHLERAYFNGSSMDTDEVLCWTRGETSEPRRTHIEEIYEVYRTKYALETALLKPFSDVSRFKHEEHSVDGQGKTGDRTVLDSSLTITQAQWWKRLLNWDTLSFVSVACIGFDMYVFKLMPGIVCSPITVEFRLEIFIYSMVV